MKITIGIPCYKAQKTICDCLSSIQIQSVKNDLEIILAKDHPADDYNFVKECFPDLDIKILGCEKNTGPGLARQRALDAATGDWITFIDADDVFMGPLAIEGLLRGIQPNVIEVQGIFYQEVTDHPQGLRLIPQDNPNHPWVFGRLYNVAFLRENKIAFSELRAMEDGEFNWKIRMSIEGSPLMINLVQEPIYFWRVGSEHSITRIGVEDGIPQYNFDLCQVGATTAAINAVKFCRAKNPFNAGIMRFAVENMVGQYFTYVECCERKPVFAEQNFFNAKKFYNECYKQYEHLIDENILKDLYTFQMTQKSQDLLGIIPSITFFDFLKKVKSEPYGGEEEFNKIRKKLPEYIIKNDEKSGVLGERKE